MLNSVCHLVQVAILFLSRLLVMTKCYHLALFLPTSRHVLDIINMIFCSVYSDIVKEKVAAAFTYRRHGYLREGAVERFLPLPDKWKKMLKSNNMTDDETRPSGPETNKNEAQMHLPALKVNGTKTEHQTTSFSNGGSQPTGYLSLPHVHIDGPEDPMETSSMSHHQSRPASASSSNVTLPENSEVNTLFSDSEQEDQPRDESDKTEWLAKNAEKMARAVELIRSRMAARDSRDAKKSYPSPGHKIHNVNSPRRARFMTDGEYRWKAVDPRQISYFSMFAPLLDVSHVGWKRYKQA